jgi:Rieske Fe-S protein
MELDRRTVLQVSGLVAVGGLAAACSSGSDAAASSAATSAAESAGSSAAASSSSAGGAVAVSDVPVGGGVILADQQVVVTQPTDGDVHAFSAICTHEGCLVGSVANDAIVCPCHGSQFSATDGSVLQGPATEPLPAVAFTVENGSVLLS